MAGKKWCEYCRINIAYTKKDIQDHQSTRQHLQNKQKAIQFERIKVRKQRQQKKQGQHQVMLSTANIPKAKRGSQLQNQVSQYRSSVINQGKSAIHMLIAQQTQGLYGAPIEYPQKQDLVLAQNYEQQGHLQKQQKQENFSMWKIDICEQNGEPCFVNRITKLKLYQPPRGYLLSEQEKQEWDYLKQICKDKVLVDPQATVNITEWQVMDDSDNYFQQNKVVDSDDQVIQRKQNQVTNKNIYQKYLPKRQQQSLKLQQQIIQPLKTWKDNLADKLYNNQISTNQVFQLFIQQEMKNSKTIKQKNQNLKKLIESGIQIRARPTDDLINDYKTDLKVEDKGKVTFKQRKKVQLNNQDLLLKDKDFV